MFLICLIFQYLWMPNILDGSSSRVDKRLSGLPILEQATYNCPCEKQSVCKYKPHKSKDCPCALLIVIANTNRIGNYNLLNWNDICWNHWNSQCEDIFTFERPCQTFCFYDVGPYFFYWKTCAITKLGLVDISQHDNWHIIKYLLNNKINGISIMKKNI